MCSRCHPKQAGDRQPGLAVKNRSGMTASDSAKELNFCVTSRHAGDATHCRRLQAMKVMAVTFINTA
jgi:hypothetical protein